MADTAYGTFNQVYRAVLEDIAKLGDVKSSRLGKTVELRNISYTISEESTQLIEFEEEFESFPENMKKPNFEYAEAFSDWVLSGSTVMAEELLRINPFVKNYDANQSDLSTYELPANFSMFYGPRVHAQLNAIVDELYCATNTRRAFLGILDPMNDNKLLKGLRDGELKTVEYPCTIGFLFDIHEEEKMSGTRRQLNMTVIMRSQNMVTVWPYDYLIGRKLLRKVCAELNAAGMRIVPGLFSGIVTSAHIYERDFEFLEQLTGVSVE